MTRTWLLTWTTYGTWLPGDHRGFVTRVRTAGGEPATHNQYGTPYDAGEPGPEAYARSIMKHESVRLTAEQARHVAGQFYETAGFRGWSLLALAVLSNHLHLVVEAPAETVAGKLLADFKAYATRRLDREDGTGRKRKWWTERGSTRLLPDEDAVADAVSYVRRQPAPLVVWSLADASGAGSTPAG